MNKKDLAQIRELIREELASKSKCTVIEDELEFEVGKWYKGLNCKRIVAYCEDPYKKGFKGYGLDDGGFWHDSGHSWLQNQSVPIECTKSEIESALTKEAKRRGFKVGNTVCSVMKGFEGQKYRIGDEPSYVYNRDLTNADLSLGGVNIFYEGKWSTIIEDKLEINGKEVRKDLGEIIIGCKTGSLSALTSMVEELEHWGVDTIHHPETGDVKVKDLKYLL